MPQCTINPDLDFSDEEEASVVEQLKEAMDGSGTNEDKIIEILVGYNNRQRRRIALAFQAAMGKPLDESLKDELSGDFEEVILAMLKAPRELDAIMIHDAMAGLGTDERMLVTIMTTKTNDELNEIKEEYKKLYESELEDDLVGETSGYFQRMMRSILTGFRQVEECDDDFAAEQAQKLVDAGVGQCGTDECDFNQVLCLNSLASVRKILDKYREIRGAELEDDICAEFSGDIAEGYKAIIRVARNQVDFFAERLYNDTVGKFFGTNDAELIRIIVARSEIDLGDICEAFEAKYGQSLYDVIASETSGDYQQTLLSIVKGEFVPKEC